MRDDPRQLLLRAAAGHDRAARRLWNSYGPALIAYAALILRDHGRQDAAHDVVQGVFCRLLEMNRRDLKAVQDVAPWLTRLTRNAALNHRLSELREHDRRRALPSPMSSAPVDDGLQRALDALEAEQREVIVLRHVMGLTFDQIGVALETNRNTVASRHRTALERLREQLGAPAEEVTRV